MSYSIQRTLLIVAVGVVMVSCASTVPLTPDVAKTLTNREVTVARRDQPSFWPMSREKLALGFLHHSFLIVAGDELVAQNKIDDPAKYIGQQLSQDLAAQYGTTVASNPVKLADDDVEAIAKNHPTADLVLEVRTTLWGFMYYTADTDRHRVNYAAQLRLIDVKGGRIIAEGSCSHRTEEAPSAPTYDELVANSAERLKEELRGLADLCVGEFKTKVFQM